MKTLMALLLSTTLAAAAEDLTLNDLPGVLYKLRDCHDEPGFLGLFKNGTTCRLTVGELWVSVHSDGELTLFKTDHAHTKYGSGHTVSEMLRDFARALNEEQVDNKAILERLAPYLPGQ